MAILIPSWRPSRRNITYSEKPEEIPEYVYSEAKTAKFQYNENWEYWVWMVSRDYNCSIAEAEDACIRGIKKAILQLKLVYGDKIGQWFEDYLDMGDIFNKVTHPIYLPKLGD